MKNNITFTDEEISNIVNNLTVKGIKVYKNKDSYFLGVPFNSAFTKYLIKISTFSNTDIYPYISFRKMKDGKFNLCIEHEEMPNSNEFNEIANIGYILSEITNTKLKQPIEVKGNGQ